MRFLPSQPLGPRHGGRPRLRRAHALLVALIAACALLAWEHAHGQPLPRPASPELPRPPGWSPPQDAGDGTGGRAPPRDAASTPRERDSGVKSPRRSATDQAKRTIRKRTGDKQPRRRPSP